MVKVRSEMAHRPYDARRRRLLRAEPPDPSRLEHHMGTPLAQVMRV